ncbi:MAG TPA: PIN domain nuclease [Blastocatellia bacterium]|nr:PIN domain nuclease [Blastocatellia bacterium]
MKILLDSNILTRSVQPSHPMCLTAVNAVTALRNQNDLLCVAPQSLYEFWVVATRPLGENGIGLTIQQAGAELARIRAFFELLPDNATTYSVWEKLVRQHQVKGKPAHDARFAALMITHGVTHMLTFNFSDFKRFNQITAIDPHSVAQSNP